MKLLMTQTSLKTPEVLETGLKVHLKVTEYHVMKFKVDSIYFTPIIMDRALASEQTTSFNKR